MLHRGQQHPDMREHKISSANDLQIAIDNAADHNHLGRIIVEEDTPIGVIASRTKVSDL